ncbi:MAG: sterol desaturase family protein [Methylococcales bacterium]|nr:MAG: sterol desaturase family protein [Methylococcales bacterium]
MAVLEYFIEGLRLLAVLAISFSLLEALCPLNKQHRIRSNLKVDLGHGLVNSFVLYFPLMLALAPPILLSQTIIPASFNLLVSSQPGWLQFLEMMFVADLGIYIGHRLVHTVPFLWKFHSIHHSAKELDWAISYRNHTVDLFVMRWCMLSMLLMIPFDTSVLSIYFIYFALHSAFLHSNTRIHFGPLRFLYASPWFHRWHHSDHPEARDKNFVVHFPWIDALFGTLYLPKEPPKTLGIDEPIAENLLEQWTYPFRR